MQGKRSPTRKNLRTSVKSPLNLFRRGAGCAQAALSAAAVAVFLAAAPAGSPAAEKLSGGPFILARSVTAAEGRGTASGGLVFDITVGEAVTIPAAGGGFRLLSGYIPAAAQPGSIASIAAAAKSTGTLELSWLAPGLDGLKGGVAGGFYRVDYSSDPFHSFRVSSYRLEFSTTLAAGEPQFLAIEGLRPNTTYYTKIYLADSSRYFAEDSRRSSESTLANAPAAPFFPDVSADSVTVSWLLPEGGAADYQVDASTAGFNGQQPGGGVISAETPDGFQLSLTLGGLEPGTEYFFRVAGRNWQGEKNFAPVMAAATLGPPVKYLRAAANSLGRAVTLTWVNAAGPAPRGALVIVSTSPDPCRITGGGDFSPGETLDGNALVKSTAASTSFTDYGLPLDIPYFYHIYNRFSNRSYSAGVSTSVFLDLPPMAPAGLDGTVTDDRGRMLLGWKPVTANFDGSFFHSTAAPMAAELERYRIERTDSLSESGWISLATVPATTLAYADDIPDPDRIYFYRVSALDSLGASDNAMIVNTLKSLFVTASDQATRLEIPPELADSLKAANNPTGKDILIRAVEQPEKEGGEVLREVRFEALSAGDDKALEKFQFSAPILIVTLSYGAAGGSAPRAARAFAPRAPAGDDGNLAMYWDNGDRYVKLYGNVDAAKKTVSVKTAMTGSYQIRGLYRDSGTRFDISNLTNRMITPNGDGLNDEAVFTFDNPRDSAYSGKIYDAAGAFVADMRQGPVGGPGSLTGSLKWDGKANGRSVQGGVYIYQIRAENKVFNGTLVVAR